MDQPLDPPFDLPERLVNLLAKFFKLQLTFAFTITALQLVTLLLLLHK